MKRENQVILAIILIVLLIVAAFGIYYLNKGYLNPPQITDFEECAAAGYPIMESSPRKCRTPDGRTFTEGGRTDRINSYFIERFRERAIENNGGAMPIEGFDPDLYMSAYPALVSSDFNNAQAINGRWILQGNELVFDRDDSSEITSADGTITDTGLITLLNNLERRLDLDINTQSEVNSLVAQLSADSQEEDRN